MDFDILRLGSEEEYRAFVSEVNRRLAEHKPVGQGEFWRGYFAARRVLDTRAIALTQPRPIILCWWEEDCCLGELDLSWPMAWYGLPEHN